jgi:hypothetical protein
MSPSITVAVCYTCKRWIARGNPRQSRAILVSPILNSFHNNSLKNKPKYKIQRNISKLVPKIKTLISGRSLGSNKKEISKKFKSKAYNSVIIRI